MLSVPGGTLLHMFDRTVARAPEGVEPTSPREGAACGADPVWLLVDTLADIVDTDPRDVRGHMVVMNAHGTRDGQCAVVAEMAGYDHPGLLHALDLLARHHPDPVVAREARKTAMRVRTRAACF